ncbi:MAG: hypothetical protein JNN12_16150 [Bacteroidetes Order II. Incertae sedis bacterium]|nr:hypothetical protein [Bacteroidetes Order II. bacterium]
MKEEKLNSIEGIKDLIASGDTDQALSDLLRFFYNEAIFPERLSEEAYLLSHQYHYFLRRTRLGLVEDTSEMNKVNSKLLYLIDEIKYFYENDNSDRLSNRISELRRRQFLAESLHELKVIVYEARRLLIVYPDRYELIRLIEEIERAINYEKIRDKTSYPTMPLPKATEINSPLPEATKINSPINSPFSKRRVLWLFLVIIIIIALLLYLMLK